MYLDYLLAVLSYSWTIAPGVIMAGLNVWDYYHDKRTTFSRRQILAIFGLALVVAQFLAWRDERKKVLGQFTYMAITVEDAPPTPAPFFQVGEMPAMNLRKSNRGSFIARSEYSCAHIYLAESPSPWVVDPYSMPPSTTPLEDSIYNNFQKACKTYRKPVSSFIPNQRAATRAAADFSMEDQLKNSLVQGKMLMFVVAFTVWTDGAGKHEQEYCWIVRPPAEKVLTVDACYSHNDFLTEAAD
jgi:hypothetical protein